LSYVEYELKDHVAVIRLNRPDRLNAVGDAMRVELTEAFKELNDDDSAWVGILTGAGRAFCAGRDLKAQAEGCAKNQGNLTGHVYTAERNIFGTSDTNKPLIAAVHGFAIGLGWYMMMACDIRIAAVGTQFGMAEVPNGALGPYWMASAELLPWPIAAELALIGERLSADRLFGWGLINAVVSEAQLLPEAYKWAEKFLLLPPRQVQSTKALMVAMRSLPGEALQATERQVRGELAELADTKEAVLAWNERRKPEFKGA
jgi:enoyl-CoA hydratase/carnithine racemase